MGTAAPRWLDDKGGSCCAAGELSLALRGGLHAAAAPRDGVRANGRHVEGSDPADLAGFYRAYSLELSSQEGDHEVYDHLSVELEFYSSLLARHALVTQADDAEGIEVVLETRKAFLRDHLGRLAQALTKHAQLDAESAWAPALAATVALVTSEYEALGVKPPPLDYVLTLPTDEVACAVNLNPAGGRAAP